MGLSSYVIVSVASCCAAASKFVPILPLIWTMSWDSRFHTVCVGLDGTYVPNTLSKLRFSPTTTIRWRIGDSVLPTAGIGSSIVTFLERFDAGTVKGCVVAWAAV